MYLKVIELFSKLKKSYYTRIKVMNNQENKDNKHLEHTNLIQPVAQNNTVYYFAYGSNMEHKQMTDRCGKDCKFIKKVYLKDYEFRYDGHSKTRKGAVANVINAEGKKVWGGLFEISQRCLSQLDTYEGFHGKGSLKNSYDRKEMEVHDTAGKAYVAFVYFRTDKIEGTPSNDYRETVLRGAHNCDLPEEYIHDYII